MKFFDKIELRAGDFLWAVIAIGWFTALVIFAIPSKDTKPIATIDCDIVHTIPNLPDDILKQCERMKIK